MDLTIASILFANLVWGLSPILAKIGLQNVSEVNFLLIRFGLSTIFFFPLVLSAAKKIGRLKFYQLLIGVITVAAHYYLQVFALRHAPVTWYVFFYSLCPILSLFVVRVNPSIKLIAVGVLAIAGTWLFADMESNRSVTIGTLFALSASVATWVLFTYSIKSWQKQLSDSEISATTSALSFLIFGLIAIFQAESVTSGWTSSAAASTIALSLLLPAAFYAYSYSLRRNAGLAVLGQYSEPLFGTAGAVLFLGEVISIRQTLGLVMVAVALGLLLFRSRTPSKQV